MPRKSDQTKGRSKYQRERILAALASGPMTAQDLADKLYLHKDTINIHLRTMHAEQPKALHIAGYRYNPNGGRRCATYAPGNKPDAKFVNSRTPTRHLLVDERIKTILEILKREPMTSAQLAATMQLSSQWIRKLLYRLQNEAPRRVHIHSWPHAATGIQPVYGYGDKPDAVRVPFTSTESSRRRNNKRKAWISTLIGTMPTKLPLAGAGRVYNMDNPREAA